jgi:hypothetical protein
MLDGGYYDSSEGLLDATRHFKKIDHPKLKPIARHIYVYI